MGEYLREMYGQWWLADDPSVHAVGRLVVEEAGATRLELAGSLLQMDFEKTTVFGMAEGIPVTLLRSSFLSSRGHGGGPGAASQHLYVARALIGIHVHPDAAMFSSARIELENLPGFLAADVVDRAWDDNRFKYVAGVNEQVSTASFDEWTITALSHADVFQSVQSRSATQVSSTVTAYLHLTPPTPVPAHAFDELILHLSDLLTLASGEACGIISRTLSVEQIGPEPSADSPPRWFRPTLHAVDVYERRIHTPSRALPGVPDGSFRFTCADLPFDQVVPAWLKVRRDAETACNVFFGIQYARPGFTETRLLLSAIAAEGFHTAFSSKTTSWPVEQFEEMRGKLLMAVSDSKEREWVASNIENRVTFRRRLRDLARMPNRHARREVVADTEAWADNVVAARNSLAHTGNHLENTDPFALERVTTGLLTLVLMARIGLDAEVQLRAASLLRARN